MEITASGVLTSWATPAASKPMLRQLVGLHQAPLQLGAVGDVVEDDQAADLLLVPRNQRRDGDVQRGLAKRRTIAVSVPVAGSAAARRFQHELVDVVDAGLAAHAVELLGQLGGEQLGQLPAHGAVRGAMPLSCSICVFQLSTRSSRSAARMPTLIDSTMFSLNSFSRSYSSTLRCSER